MKDLKALVVHHENSDKTIFSNVANGFQHLKVDYSTDIEQVLDAMRNGEYDLLIVDKTLGKEDIKKLDTLSAVLFPDAAITSLLMIDEEYIKFKLGGLMVKWQDAQSDRSLNFIDDPEI